MVDDVELVVVESEDDCCAEVFCAEFDDEDDFFVRAFFREDTVFSVAVVALEFFSPLLELLPPVFELLRFFIFGIAPVARNVKVDEELVASLLLLLAFGLISGPADAARLSRSFELLALAVM